MDVDPQHELPQMAAWVNVGEDQEQLVRMVCGIQIERFKIATLHQLHQVNSESREAVKLIDLLHAITESRDCTFAKL